LRELKAHGFKVRFEQPPKIGVYGLFEARSRTLWVHPITFELGISRQTLLHEAVHAAQSAPKATSPGLALLRLLAP
jgi:hypothetical protein